MPASAVTPAGEDRPLYEPFFLTLADTTEDCLRILNPRGEVLFMNERGKALFGIKDWTRNQGKYWPGLWPEISYAVVESAVRSALEGEVVRFRAYCPTTAGEVKWWHNIVSPVRGGAGEVVALIATSRDVTAELETESFLNAVIESVPMTVFVKDAEDGRFQLVNRSAEAIFGLTREEMIGKTDYDFFPAEQADFFRLRDHDVITSGKMVHIEEEPVTTADKGVRWLRTKKVAIQGPKGPRHLVCVCEDITEERQAAELLKAALARAEGANRAKSEFLANMSHEIRTPLNGVVGVADVLANTTLDARQAQMVELIRSSASTLERLLSDILDLARVESGQIELQEDVFNVADVVRDVAGLLDLRAREKDIRLAVDVAPQAEGWRVGDAVRVKQVLTNLLNNAVKFTERGEVRLTVRTDGETLRFEVKDTGIGFDPAIKAQLFNRFQQVDGSITRRFGGSGLGLAITRQLVELMGGEVGCDSRPGIGSLFTVRLPLRSAAAPAAAACDPTSAGEITQASEGALRVLLADDHPTNRKVVELILEQVGIELVAVEDGAQALEAFGHGTFDLVLMDVQMPVLDGLAATRAIRELERRADRGRIPIIMLTANALPEHVQASLDAGADRHLPKPVTAVGLLGAIAEATAAADYAPEALRA